MNKQLLYNLIHNPKELNESTLKGIQELVDEYPFFQAARLLLLKNLHFLDHVRYEPELKRSVLFVTDRTCLFELIYNLYPVGDYKREPELQKENRAEESKEKTSSIAVTGKVESVGNYFRVDDVNETMQGGAVGFTFESKDEEVSDNGYMSVQDDQLFEYEKADNLGYSLNIYESPLDVEQNRSFSAWLSVVGQQPVDNSADKQANKARKKNKTINIIEDFLNNRKSDSKPVKSESTKKQKEIKETSSFDSEELMTETLAGIYIKQGYFEKANNIFEKLSLKYPEKSVYFAQQIKKLKKIISNQ